MVNSKGQQMTLGTIISIVLGIAVLIFLIYGFSTGWGNVYCNFFPCSVLVPQQNCEYVSVLEIGLDEYDHYEVKGAVEDYFIDDKELNTLYWDRICEDLLEVNLEGDLNKSEHMILLAGGSYTEHNKQLYCDFEIFWDGEGENYMRKLDAGFRYFDLVDILPATEKRPAIYNESLVSVEWREDYMDTIIKNENRDYYIKVNLLLNESTLVCE